MWNVRNERKNLLDILLKRRLASVAVMLLKMKTKCRHVMICNELLFIPHIFRFLHLLFLILSISYLYLLSFICFYSICRCCCYSNYFYGRLQRVTLRPFIRITYHMYINHHRFDLILFLIYWSERNRSEQSGYRIWLTATTSTDPFNAQIPNINRLLLVYKLKLLKLNYYSSWLKHRIDSHKHIIYYEHMWNFNWLHDTN